MNLGRTQRDIIRQNNEIEMFEEEQVNATRTDDVQFKMSKDASSGKKVYCWPKGILLVVAIIALLAGIILLIIFLWEKDNENHRGNITKDKKPEEECPAVSVILGNKIVIICKYTTARIEGKVTAMHPNLVGAKTSDFDCISPNNTMVTCTAKERAKCSSHGDVIVRFYDDFDDFEENRRLQFQETVKVNVVVPDKFPIATIEQIYNDSLSQSEFNLTCVHRRDCVSYELGFFANGIKLADRMSCTTTFSDEDGYTVSCTATVHSQIIFKHGNGTKMFCKLMHGSVMKKEKELALPFCHDYSIMNENCNADNTSLYNCNNTQLVGEDCTSACSVANACFPVRVQELNHGTALCPTECALKWCRDRDTLAIDESGKLSFESLCPAST